MDLDLACGMLEPVDIVVLLKLSIANCKRRTYLQMGNELHFDPPEVYSTVKRERESDVIQGPERNDGLNRSGLKLDVMPLDAGIFSSYIE